MAPSTPPSDRDVRGRSEREPGGKLTPFRPREETRRDSNNPTQQGRWDFFFPPVKYLIKPHKGANALLKLMKLYKKC